MEAFVIDYFPFIMGGMITLFCGTFVYLGFRTSKEK